MDTKTVFLAAKVVAKIESLIGCFERTETANGEPLSEKTLKFNASVAETLRNASEVIEALLTNH